MADICRGLEESFNRMLAIRVAARERIEAHLKDKGNQICPTHTKHLLIDMDLSVHESISTQQMQIIWKQCPECIIEADLHRSGVPKNLVHCTLDNFKPTNETQKKALAVMTEYNTMRQGFLIIAGEQFGIGKSHLSVAVMRRKPKDGRFITQAEFLTKLRQTYRNPDAEDIVTACKRIGLLILDDVGLSVGGRDELPTLHEVLNHRYGNKMRTILTTNMNDEEMKQTLGPRMIDRLRESVFSFIKLDGASQRRAQKDNYLARGTTQD